jgi:hypothetical protein
VEKIACSFLGMEMVRPSVIAKYGPWRITWVSWKVDDRKREEALSGIRVRWRFDTGGEGFEYLSPTTLVGT